MQRYTWGINKYVAPIVLVIVSIVFFLFTQVELLFCTEQVSANWTFNEIGYGVRTRAYIVECVYDYDGESYNTKKFSFVAGDWEIKVYIDPDNPSHVVIPKLNNVISELIFVMAIFSGLVCLVIDIIT